jgi:hypothetical protein
VLIPDGGGGGKGEVSQFGVGMGVVEKQHDTVRAHVRDLELEGNVTYVKEAMKPEKTMSAMDFFPRVKSRSIHVHVSLV